MRLIKQFGAATLRALEYPAAIMGALLVISLGYMLETRRPGPAT